MGHREAPGIWWHALDGLAFALAVGDMGHDPGQDAPTTERVPSAALYG
jgi:hypothetical protein